MEAARRSQSTHGRGAIESSGKAYLASLVGLPLLVGLALRIWMLKWLFEAEGDSLVYGGLAKNLLLHGRVALTLPNGEICSTLIRLPGYPLFLAVCFRLFGMENYFTAACAQIALELCGCVLLADLARRIAPPHLGRAAAIGTLWLAVLCPFTASYAVLPLAEGPTLFMLALAMWAAVRFVENPGWRNALWFTFAVTVAALLRPDGALAAVAFAPAILIGIPRADRTGRNSPHIFLRMATVCILLALAPFVLWTIRNWRVFHVFQPLAPQSATDPGERVNTGWERWVKTWCLDYVSTYEIYWNVPGDKLDVTQLPSRAFDSAAQRAETVSLANEYNRGGMEITPQIDAGFSRLAEERVHADPLRFYVLLPLGRVADMWLRPRVENLPIDLDWWVYAHHHAETRFSWAWAALNAVYLALGLAGLCLRPRFWAAMFAYMVLRSALLLTVVAPEARYTVECFPMLFVLGGVAIAKLLETAYLLKAKASLGRG